RTGTGKIYRQGIKTPDELAGGFPTTEEDLYGFKAVIFGDIEASAFSPDQLRLVERFVRERGGGFLMLGGRNAFSEGFYDNTPIADVLPVTLDPSRRQVLPTPFSVPDKDVAEQGFKFIPTSAGAENPILKFSPNSIANLNRWTEMPGLTSINYLGSVKPGASVLAEKPEDDFGDGEPLLVVQRYGKGRTAALATSSTWRWQMLLDSEDARHERFWRQMARWLVASAPNRVDVDLGQARFAPDEDVPLTVSIYDDSYRPQSGAEVRGLLTDPFGTVSEVTFQEELANEGTYTWPFVPQDEGLYELSVVAETDAGVLTSQPKSFLVRPSNKEFYDATLKRAFLQNLATTAGGSYYTPAEAGVIPDNLRSRRTSTSIFHAEYLWDMPFLFGLVLLLLSAEWMYRRRKGLP
ncbi:MAG TPA: glutamine amidotransferase, partial [Rhodothermales bacterium]|nr:glutamine amidotransferase [Rhodothermales bacterium]